MNNKWVGVFYLRDGVTYKPEVFSQKTWRAGDYYLVTYILQMELLSRRPQECLEELLFRTNTARWISQYRRPMCRGDMIVWNSQLWLFAPIADARNLGLRPTILPTLPDSAAYRISYTPEQEMGLCKNTVLETIPAQDYADVSAYETENESPDVI